MNNKGKSRKRAVSKKAVAEKDASDHNSNIVEGKSKISNTDVPEKKSRKRTKKVDANILEGKTEENTNSSTGDNIVPEKKSRKRPKKIEANNNNEQGQSEELESASASAKLPKSSKAKKPNKNNGKKAQKTDATVDTSSLDDFKVTPSQARTASPDDDFQDQPKTAIKKSTSKKPRSPKPKNRSILQLKIVMADIKPPIWRRIQVLNNDTFWDLQGYIREAFGWLGAFSHQFIVPKRNGSALIVNGALEGVYNFSESDTFKQQTTRLSRFLNAPGDQILFEFDLGDSWLHHITVEKVLPPPGLKAEYPKCKGGKRNCPPEECGGVEGYNHLMEVYKNPQHEEYQELIVEWLGDQRPGWDPEEFDRKKIFRRVWMWCAA